MSSLAPYFQATSLPQCEPPSFTPIQNKRQNYSSVTSNFWIAIWKTKLPPLFSPLLLNLSTRHVSWLRAAASNPAVSCYDPGHSTCGWQRATFYLIIHRLPWQYHSTSTWHTHSFPIHPMPTTHWQQRLFKQLNGASRPHPPTPPPNPSPPNNDNLQQQNMSFRSTKWCMAQNTGLSTDWIESGCCNFTCIMGFWASV